MKTNITKNDVKQFILENDEYGFILAEVLGGRILKEYFMVSGIDNEGMALRCREVLFVSLASELNIGRMIELTKAYREPRDADGRIVSIPITGGKLYQVVLSNGDASSQVPISSPTEEFIDAVFDALKGVIMDIAKDRLKSPSSKSACMLCYNA